MQRILLLTPKPPVKHATDGGMVFVRRMFEYLVQKNEVDLISFKFDQDENELNEITSLCRQSFFINDNLNRSITGKIKRRIISPLHCKPIRVFNHSIDFSRIVRECVRNCNYNIIQAEFTSMGQYIKNLNHQGTILDDVDVRALTCEQKYRNTLSLLRKIPLYLGWKRMQAYEGRLSSKIGKILVRTKYDKDYLQHLNPKANISIITHGVDISNVDYSGYQHKELNLLFIGAFNHPPNRDAIIYFVKDIFPVIREKYASIVLKVIGQSPPKEIENVNGVQALGFVNDLEPYLKEAAVFVSPIRWGSGIKTKNLEAMRCGIPVVTTTCGIEGIEAIDGESVMIADDKESFSDKVLLLLQNENLRRRVGFAGGKIIREKYTWKIIFAELECIYDEMSYTSDNVP